ncbi:heavy-metal-associated domain-containing protein [Ochrovirga pacifica]|uniref:heavy-metal-associated domain-containing protein n=1 Tax=Ochrovirga pacifica TaxID=1042376 RepID=UPI0002557FCB|nr:heavy-metal-associated domain-containing protein [Ochrovirga pacifica]
MNKYILSVAIAALSLGACKKNQPKENNTTETKSVTANTTTVFGVRGNCAMCKYTIEKAAKEVPGVATAVWDVEAKKVTVTFNKTATNQAEINQAIADSGYDTELTTGNIDAYAKLPECCKYDHSMKMNQ